MRGRTAVRMWAPNSVARIAGRRHHPQQPRGGPSTSAFLDWTVRYAVPLAGIVAALLYGVLRLSYVLFYIPLRTTPEEVGYGYVEILAGQLIGAIELVLVVGVLILTVSMMALQLRWVLRRSARQESTHPAPPILDRVCLRKVGARSGLAAVILVALGLPALAWHEGREASLGTTKRNIFVRPFALPVLPVQAVPATIQPPTSLASTGFGLEDRQCLMYLGRADNTVVFYDVASQESLRVTSEALLVTLQRTFSAPAACRRGLPRSPLPLP